MELVLATLTIPPKEDPKEKDEVSTTAASTQLPKDLKDKLVIKMKNRLFSFFLCFSFLVL